MEIKHFSHEHPLILNKEAHKNESLNKVVCYGCQIPIADCDDDNSTAYECATCNLFLHKRCAEAPTKIIHPKHPQHFLTLLSHPSNNIDSVCTCDVCLRSRWQWFTYNCSRCDFDMDIICALRDMDIISALKEDRRFEHKSHEHPLTFQLRPALFLCDACGTQSKDCSYLCTTCPFWIHKTCALLPNTIKHSHHNHTLNLAYSLPDMYRGFKYVCDICRTRVDPIDWLYYCRYCRYFVHVKCASGSKPLLQRDDEDHQNLDLFPIPADKYADLMSQFVKKISLGDADCDGKGEIKIDHWNHDHPLILWDGQSKNELNTNIVYDGMYCAACMQPITAPFYHCRVCSYFLHRYCAVLPLELQHPGHPDHPLKINNGINNFVNFDCTCCGLPSSGFCYSCQTCKIYIDIGCVSLPTKILHKSHKHPLVTSRVSKCLCDACDQWCSRIAYKCETCSYNLAFRCARLPCTLTHDYDEHPISLTYPPIENHPSEFYCEICEEEIHPKFWLYYCHECSYSFHIECIRPVDKYSNVKFWDICEVNNIHEHPLTLVQNGGNKSPCPCASCGKDKS